MGLFVFGHPASIRIAHCKKNFQIPGFFYQTFLGLELATLFPARESLVSDIPAGDGNIKKLFYSADCARRLKRVRCGRFNLAFHWPSY